MAEGAPSRGERGRHVVIAGAGLAGSLLAVYLARRGYEVDVYERRADSRKKDSAWEGKSINLALSARGLSALAGVGLDEEVAAACVKMKCRAMHDQSSTTSLRYMQYGAFDHEHIYSMERRMLQEKLISRAEEDGARFHFNSKIVEYDVRKNIVHVEVSTTEPAGSGHGDVDEAQGVAARELRTIEPDVVIGADGAFSRIRKAMATLPRFDFAQKYLDHGMKAAEQRKCVAGYKELSIGAVGEGDSADWRMKPVHALHIWPRGEFMMIALPNPDKTWTVTLFLPWEGEESFAGLKTDAQVLAFFRKYFPDVMPHLEDHLLTEWNVNKASPLVTMRMSPWHHKNYCLLIGDAAHAVVPFYGQGMNASLQDVEHLNRLLDDHHDDWDAVMPIYTRLRQPEGNAISDLSHRNYVEMRASVRSTWFLLKQRLDRFLHRMLGDRWIPLYEMVAFKTMPYTAAIERDAWQASFLSRLVNFLMVSVAMGGVAGAVFLYRNEGPFPRL